MAEGISHSLDLKLRIVHNTYTSASPILAVSSGSVVKFGVAGWAEDYSVVKLPSKFRVIKSRGTFRSAGATRERGR